MVRHRCSVVLALTLLGVAACEEQELTVPTAGQVQSYFEATPGLTAGLNGNVAEITVVQPYSQVQRGGRLWAKVGPYIYLFSQETEQLLIDFPGLAGVRVVTTTSSQGEIARAFIERDAMTDVLWRRAKNIAGLARRDGTERPSLLEDLVEWGEDKTEYRYNPRFVSR